MFHEAISTLDVDNDGWDTGREMEMRVKEDCNGSEVLIGEISISTDFIYLEMKMILMILLKL